MQVKLTKSADFFQAWRVEKIVIFYNLSRIILSYREKT